MNAADALIAGDPSPERQQLAVEILEKGSELRDQSIAHPCLWKLSNWYLDGTAGVTDEARAVDCLVTLAAAGKEDAADRLRELGRKGIKVPDAFDPLKHERRERRARRRNSVFGWMRDVASSYIVRDLVGFIVGVSLAIIGILLAGAILIWLLAVVIMWFGWADPDLWIAFKAGFWGAAAMMVVGAIGVFFDWIKSL